MAVCNIIDGFSCASSHFSLPVVFRLSCTYDPLKSSHSSCMAYLYYALFLFSLSVIFQFWLAISFSVYKIYNFYDLPQQTHSLTVIATGNKHLCWLEASPAIALVIMQTLQFIALHLLALQHPAKGNKKIKT